MKTKNSVPRNVVAGKVEPTSRQIYVAARLYVQAGICVIPVRTDGSKKTVLPAWKPYQSRLPTNDELEEWFGPQSPWGPCGLEIVLGKVSGNAEAIDFDDLETFKAWRVELRKLNQALSRKLVYVLTPRPGVHAYYRCRKIAGSQKLAQAPREDKPQVPRTLIETKGEGGLCVAPPSPASCHHNGTRYQILGAGLLSQICIITPEERQQLFGLARQFHTWKPPAKKRPLRPSHSQPAGQGTRPGDDFNSRAKWEEILEPRGWTYVNQIGDVEHWRRPGKSTGTSATINFADQDLLHVFSCNAHPFEEGRSYNKFQAYALLEHDGDFPEAARELSLQGYGTTIVNARNVRHRRKSALQHFYEHALGNS